ncbi:MAG TPA: response regulator [Candidatus Gracilibacteria bacterium]|nr:response regulator [Candidatus Gracilibacteria bacterium]
MFPNDPNNKEKKLTQPENIVDDQSQRAETVAIDDRQKTTAEATNEVLEQVKGSITFEEALEVFKQVPAIMVVDDEPLLLRSIARIFGSYVNDRKNIVTFPGPEEALAHVGELPNGSLIVCDNSMNSPIKGLDLAQQIKEVAADKNLTFILHTSDGGHDFDSLLNQGRADGSINGYIEKPASSTKILETCALALKPKLFKKD